MVLKNRTIVTCGLYSLLGAAFAFGASPDLSLTLTPVTPGYAAGATSITVPIVPGSNGPTQIVDAFNVGGGTLKLTASASAPWLVPTVEAQNFCSLRGACIPVQIALQTSSLAAGTYSGVVTISDANAVDAPQFVTVTAQVGGDVPSSLEFFVAPGGTASQVFTTATAVKSTIQPASPWLSFQSNGQGNGNESYKVTVTAASGMAAGDSKATITLTGSSFAPDNQAISVTLDVTTDPILAASPSTVSLTGVQAGIKQSLTLGITNSGQGTLTVSGVTATPATGAWLSAQSVNNGAGVTITADPTSLTAGAYPGTVTIASNAANSSVTIPVNFTVEAQSAPVAFAGLAVNNGTFAQGEPLAQGDIAAVFGDQFTLEAPAYPTGLPLPTTINGTQVMVNNTAAPLYYMANSQIDFQVPFETPTGAATVQIVRNGQQGNLISVTIAARTPRFILINGGPYPILKNSATPPAATGIPGAPANIGDVVVAYVIGLGQANPALQTGVAAPSGNTLALVDDVQVCFGQQSPFSKSTCEAAQFAGGAPGFVGLYQINFAIPKGLLPGNNPLYFLVDGVASDLAQILIQ